MENLISPGGCIRLSPYVETAQARTVFGASVDSKHRVRSWETILQKHRGTLDAAASRWVQHIFYDQGSPTDGIYTGKDQSLLHAALIAHASYAIPQTQIVLLDLLRSRRLPAKMDLFVYGEDAGVQAVAVLDFLEALGEVCQLYGQEQPFSSARIHATLPNQASQDINRCFFEAYCEAIIDRRNPENRDQQLPDIVWESASLSQAHLSHLSVEPSLAIITTDIMAMDDIDLNRLLLAIPEKTISIVITSGQDELSAGKLVTWRKDFIDQYPEYRALGPCGSEYGNQLPENCLNCQPRRQEPLHPTQLYSAFHQQINAIIGEEFTEQSNGEEDQEPQKVKLPLDPLNWSYVILQGGFPVESTESTARVEFRDGDRLSEPITLRCLSSFHPNGDIVTEPPDKPSASDDNVEFIAVCPGMVTSQRLALKREPGKHVPPLRFGQNVVARNLDVRLAQKGPILTVTDSTTYEVEEDYSRVFIPPHHQNLEDAINLLGYRLFGFHEMRPFQHQVLEQVLRGNHILGIAATGGGKSECFIMPAMLLSGITIVVTPLKSLMQDQVEQRLKARYGLGHLCTYINGDVPFKERQARLKRLEMGYYKLAYFTPEQLERNYILESLRRANENVGIRYIALDEAHCISQWGHDFRPSYLNIVRRLNDYGIDPVRIALTATASPQVRQDLCEELGLVNEPPPDGHVLVYSSNRPELNLIVRVYDSVEAKSQDILAELDALRRENRHNSEPGAAIVFMPHAGTDPDSVNSYYPKENPQQSRAGEKSAQVTRFASYVERRLGEKVCIYHGKMASVEPDKKANTTELPSKPLGDLSGRKRETEQDAFMAGERNIMIATKGFGMGIDKENIRLVIHRTPTANLEAYAQEAGRAGRDGDFANVILCYSPDASQDEAADGTDRFTPVKSDHEIQKFFISERYIRYQDVVVMRAFLKTVSRGAQGTLYFTDDEALRYFENSTTQGGQMGLPFNYEWPQFEQREYSDKFWGEHLEILRRGDEYKNKIGYIDRILAVLYRIRPDSPALGKRIPFLETVQQTNGRLKWYRNVNADGIIDSNAYFGEEFRSRGISATELRQLLDLGQHKDLLPLAHRMEKTLTETVALLSDVKFSDGRLNARNHWESALLDTGFDVPKYPGVPDSDDLTIWRNYAGAWKRVRPKRGGKTELTLDDWFPWEAVNKPVAWEVTPGPAFYADEQFDEYLKAFMALHDERQRNDWDAYYRLLTDYVGVNRDGTLRVGQQQRTCLRAALLGYLKTAEVVVGDNCRSCSVCVPDGRFSTDKEERASVVVAMEETTQAMLDNFEELSGAVPQEHQVKELLDRIDEEEAQGRRLRAYVLNWSARLLQDTPGHLGALWLRLTGAVEGVLDIDSLELIRLAQQILQRAEIDDVRRLVERLESMEQQELRENSDFLQLLANAYETLGDPHSAVIYLIDALETQPAKHTTLAIHRDIIRLTAPGAPAWDAQQYYFSLEAIGWLTNSWQEARECFSSVYANAPWQQIESVIDASLADGSYDPVNASALVWGYVTAQQAYDDDVARAVRYLLSEAADVWSLVSIDDLNDVLSRIDPAILVRHPTRFTSIVNRLLADNNARARTQAARLLATLLAERTPLQPDQAALIVSCFPEVSSQYSSVFDDMEADSLYRLASDLSPHFNPQQLSEIRVWLWVFPVDVLLSQGGLLAYQLLERVCDLVVSQRLKIDDFDSNLLAKLERLRDQLLDQAEYANQVAELWPKLLIHSPILHLRYLHQLKQRGFISSDKVERQVKQTLLAIRSNAEMEQLFELTTQIESVLLQRALTFVESLRTALSAAPRVASSSPNAADLQRFVKVMMPEHDPAKAEMLAIALQHFSQQYNPYWLTPIAYTVEALALAQRFSEAEKIVSRYRDLELGRQRIPADQFIRIRKKKAVPSFVPNQLDDVYRHLLATESYR